MRQASNRIYIAIMLPAPYLLTLLSLICKYTNFVPEKKTRIKSNQIWKKKNKYIKNRYIIMHLFQENKINYFAAALCLLYNLI
jgi:protein tyrosine phosphatase